MASLRVKTRRFWLLVLAFASLAVMAFALKDWALELRYRYQLRHGEPRAQLQALEKLGEIGSAGAVPAILQRLEDPTREAPPTAWLVVETDDPSAHDARVWHRGTTEWHRTKVSSFDDTAEIPIRQDPESIRALWKITTRHGRAAVPALTRLLDHPDWYLRCLSAALLAKIGLSSHGTIEKLTGLVLEERGACSEEVRFQAVRALGVFGDEAGSALPALTEALKHTELRGVVYGVLEKSGAPAANTTTGLERLWAHDSTAVRTHAAMTLWRRGAASLQDVVPLLVEALGERDFRVRYHAARSLGELGPDAASSLPALKEALTDPKGTVIQAADEAIRRIEDEE